MSKRENLYKAMEEVSDEHLKEAARVKLGKTVVQNEPADHFGRRIVSIVLGAACVLLILGAATVQLFRNSSQEQSGGQAEDGSGAVASSLTAETKAEAAAETQIHWLGVVRGGETLWTMEGVLMRFEFDRVMVDLEGEGPTCITNWTDLEEESDFHTGDRVRIYLAQDAAILETYPAQASIVGIELIETGTPENVNLYTLNNLAEMGYVLSIEETVKASENTDPY